MKRPLADDVKLPDVLTCPITRTLMALPVMTAAGVTYDRDAIETHLSTCDFDPTTRKALGKHPLLIPNLAVRALVEAFVNRHGAPAEWDDVAARCAEAGNCDMALAYVRYGSDPNAAAGGHQMLWWAAAHLNAPLWRELVKQGAHPAHRSNATSTSPVAVARGRYFGEVRKKAKLVATLEAKLTAARLSSEQLEARGKRGMLWAIRLTRWPFSEGVWPDCDGAGYLAKSLCYNTQPRAGGSTKSAIRSTFFTLRIMSVTPRATEPVRA